MPDLRIRQLDRDDVARAWPLVRSKSRIASLSHWKRFAHDLFERGGGVIAVSAEDGCLHGIATYEPTMTKSFGHVLQVDTLVSFELSRRAPVRHALCDALTGFARLFDCDAVRVTMPDGTVIEHPAGTRGAGQCCDNSGKVE
jgi:hypothetical protein